MILPCFSNARLAREGGVRGCFSGQNRAQENINHRPLIIERSERPASSAFFHEIELMSIDFSGAL
jgi:hypothetical protein